MRTAEQALAAGTVLVPHLAEERARADRAVAFPARHQSRPLTRAAVGCANSSVVQNRQVELAQARRVGDRVDLDDLAVPDRETEDEEQPSTPGHDDSHGSIHESRSCFLGTSRELPGHDRRTTDLP